MKYIIDISLAEDSKIVKILSCPYYMSNGKNDIVSFSKRNISIEAERGKAYTEDDLFNNVQNSLYNQMLKVLLYHYSVNGATSAISSIMVTLIKTGKQSILATREFTDAEQPLPASSSQMTLDPKSLELLMEETDDAFNLRLTIVHWLSAMGEDDMKDRLECLWRAFERICIHRRHHSRDELPYVSHALLEMTVMLRSNIQNYPQALSMASRITYEGLRNLMWHDLISGTFKNQYDLTDRRECRKFERKYIDNFIKQFEDARVVKLLLYTLEYMKSELNDIGQYNTIKTYLNAKLATNASSDADVLALMTCHYAYFLRNRLFHGHSLVKCSIFNKQDDKMGVGMTARILETLVAELINNFRNL